MKIKTIKIEQINPNGQIRSPHLPPGFINRVLEFKKILVEVETLSLEETILNFQQDRNPENELKIWEKIASAYKAFVDSNNGLSLTEKRDVLSVLLGLSMGVENFKSIKNLNENHIQKLRRVYFGDIKADERNL